jgi:hypothetical protein
VVELHSVSVQLHHRYLYQRHQYPVVVPNLMNAEQTFAELMTLQKEVKQHKQRNHSWIAFDTWQHIDCRAAL